MKRGLMSDNNELKNKITNWIIEEGATYSQSPDEDAEFRLIVNWGYDIDVIKEKTRQSLLSTSAWGFHDVKSVKAFSKLTKKQRLGFFYDLETELLKFPIAYDIEPDTFEKLDAITFYHRVYLEDLTKSEFFNSLYLITRCKNFTRLFVTNKLDLDMDAPDTDDRKAGVA